MRIMCGVGRRPTAKTPVELVRSQAMSASGDGFQLAAGLALWQARCVQTTTA